MKNKGIVYEWTNKINGRKYLGSHKGDENDGYIGSGIIFKRALKKYGIENFSREILYKGDDFKNIEDIRLKEVDAANNSIYYNLKNEAIGGSFPGEKNGMFGKKHSKKSLNKMSKSIKDNYNENRKIKHSIAMTGTGNPMYGKTFQISGIIKRAENNKGKTYEEIFGKEKAKRIKDKMSLERKGKSKNFKIVICPHCNLIGKQPNLVRYHFDNCKSITQKDI